MPRDDDARDVVQGRIKAFYLMAELARREQFLFKGWDIQFHWIVDVNCMSKYVGETEEPGEALTLDTIVMFTNEKNNKGEW